MKKKGDTNYEYKNKWISAQEMFFEKPRKKSQSRGEDDRDGTIMSGFCVVFDHI